MNERIKELAEQAQQYAEWTTPQGLEWFDAFKEKFAELIVEQCAGIIESQDVDPSFKLRMSWAVKQYFGVKE